MAEGDQIIQEVVLQGQDDIKAAFASIEAAGVKMFQSIQHASDSSTFTKLGLEILAVAGAFSAVTAAAFKFAESAVESTHDLGLLSSQAGTTIEDMSTLTAALRQSTDAMSTAFRRMAVSIENEWPIVQKAQREATTTMIADSQAVATSYLALEKAQLAAANASTVNAQTQARNATTVRGAALSLAEAQEQLRVVQGGTPDEAFNQELAKKKAILAVDNARLALAEAQRKAQEDAILQANTLAKAQLDAQSAALKLAQDLQKQAEDQRNDINSLAKVVDDLSKGITTSLTSVNLSSANLVKGLIASLGSSGDALETFGQDVTSVASAPPVLKEALLKLADVFHNSEDSALKMAVAVKLFGRSVGQDMVEQLSQGSDAIQKEQKRLEALGLTISHTDELISKDFRQTLIGLKNDLNIIQIQSGLTFAPSFTAALKAIRTDVENGRAGLVAFAQTISDKVMPAILGLAQAITGTDLGANLDKVSKDAVNSWARDFKAMGQIVTLTFGLIVGAAQATAGVLNAVFGKDTFTAFDVALGALLLRFGGLLGIIVTIGLFLEKLTGGTFSEKLIASIDSVAKAFDNLKKLIAGDIGFGEFFKIDQKIKDDLFKQFDDIDAKAKKLRDDLASGATPQIDSAVDQAIKAGKKFKDALDDTLVAGSKDAGEKTARNLDTVKTGLDKAKDPAQVLADFIAKIGPNAAAQIPQVKALADSIKLLTPGQGPSPGGIQVIDANKPFAVPPQGLEKIADASKSFGELNKALAASKQLWQDFNDVKPVDLADSTKTIEGAKEAFNKLVDDFTKLKDVKVEGPEIDLKDIKPPTVDDLKASLANTFKEAVAGVDDFLRPIGEKLLSPFEGADKAIDDLWSSLIKNIFGDTANEVATEVAPVEKSLTSPFDDAMTKIGETVRGIADLIAKPFQDGAKFATDALTPINTATEELPTKTAEALRGIPAAMQQPFAQGAQQAVQALDPLDKKLDEIIQKLLRVQTATPGGSGGSPDIPENAAGGQVFGPGGPTSDSILSWLSNREFVHPVSAVDHYGVQFMESVRRLQFPKLSMDVLRVISKVDLHALARMIGMAKMAPGHAKGGLIQNVMMGGNAVRNIVEKINAGNIVSNLANAVTHHSTEMASHFNSVVNTPQLRTLASVVNNGGPIQRFSLGGMVAGFNGATSPRSAPIGSSPAAAPSTLGVVGKIDLTTDHGTITALATVDTVKQLTTASINKQIASAGPAPSWVARRRR